MREERGGQPGPIATAARGKAASAGVAQQNPAPRRRGENDHPRARVRQRRTCEALAPGDTLRPRCGVVEVLGPTPSVSLPARSAPSTPS